ncbi:MAG TPA: LPS assembly protein LptD [Gemmatales bacterium]|nr:LPS assembly protein LptD [Gemmatales bacterium]
MRQGRQPAQGWAVRWLSWLGIVVLTGTALAQPPPLPPPPEIAPPTEAAKPIAIGAESAQSWTEDGWHVLLLRGQVVLEQGLNRLRMDQAVIWVQAAEGNPAQAVPALIYGEGNVTLEQGGSKQKLTQILTLWQVGDLRLRAQPELGRASADDPFYRRAENERRHGVPLPAVPPPSTPPIPAPNSPPPLEPPTVPQQPERRQANSPQMPDRALPPGPESEPPPGSPGVTPPAAPPAMPGPMGGFGSGRGKRIQIVPRGSSGFRTQTFTTAPDEQAVAIVGGVSIYVEDPDTGGVIDISTDRAVVWVKNMNLDQPLGDLGGGGITRDQIELYLEGHVEIRAQTSHSTHRAAQGTKLLTADTVYYDVGRNVATLTNCEIFVMQPGVPAPIVMQAREVRQINLERFEASEAVFHASRLPSDPDLQVFARSATLTVGQRERRGLFGQVYVDPRTGAPIMMQSLHASADEVTPRIMDVPFLYLPHVEGDLNEPFGPVRDVRIRSDRIFGVGAQVRWDLFQILGADSPPGTRWLLDTDYFSRRGPALGTEFTTTGDGLFGVPGHYQTLARGFIISDSGTDILGGPREYDPPRDLRGRALLRHRQDIDDHWTFRGQVSYLSDRNFLEQYYRPEFIEDLNQETFAHLQYASGNFLGEVTVQPNMRSWVNETERLPEGRLHLVGQDFFELFSYHAHASAGYYHLHSTRDVPFNLLGPVPNEFDRYRLLPPSSDTPNYLDQSLGRFDLRQELELPFLLGPVKVSPYGLLDMTYYTNTLDGEGAGRLVGGGGVRFAMPLTRLYPDISSLFFNLKGINHKVSLEGEYRYMRSNVDFRRLPLVDRLDDDATDQARRDLRLYYLGMLTPSLAPLQANQVTLATSPLFDPQFFALRRGLLDYPEVLDDLQFLRMEVRQRWQTKRGMPGQEHIIDWMTLNLAGTWFPEARRDNFDKPFAFLEYDYSWHVGDRTTFLSSGWVDPISSGARYFNAGLFIERPERLAFYVGFRQIDPLGVSALIFSSSYVLSPKYQVTLASTYDFGLGQNLGNGIVFSRFGSDLQANLGFTYDALRRNFGVTFEIFPILASPTTGRRAGLVNSGQAGLIR